MFNFFKNNFKTNKSDAEIEIKRTLLEDGIEFKINKIENDRKFRSYTIKAISEEVGFNNPESFSKAFFRIKKIQPSEFIRKIQETTKIKKPFQYQNIILPGL